MSVSSERIVSESSSTAQSWTVDNWLQWSERMGRVWWQKKEEKTFYYWIINDRPSPIDEQQNECLKWNHQWIDDKLLIDISNNTTQHTERAEPAMRLQSPLLLLSILRFFLMLQTFDVCRHSITRADLLLLVCREKRRKNEGVDQSNC